MARISGVNIPTNKKVNIALTYIFGIGKKIATDICKNASIDIAKRVSELKDEEIAWEIILSEEKIFSQGKEYWLWEEKEFYKLLIHSILHILWYDHELDNEYKIMQDFEDKIWQELFEK